FYSSELYTDIAKKMNPTTSSIPNLAVLFFLYLKLFTRRTIPTTKKKSMTQNPMIFLPHSSIKIHYLFGFPFL
ncbi:hypothetical protein P9232_14665, partial [Weizmannia sp. CD-2023]|uniref:hypothetical protein n=1 Tax=Heyndrickxia TaxID=2837504 RepID=UPI002E205BBE|nr:hypothetical protein [Weizmannia sp. CD-2023]